MAYVAMEIGWAVAAHLGVVMWGCLENMSSHPEMLLSYVDLYLL